MGLGNTQRTTGFYYPRPPEGGRRASILLRPVQSSQQGDSLTVGAGGCTLPQILLAGNAN